MNYLMYSGELTPRPLPDLLPSVTYGFHSATAQNQPWVFVEKDEIRKPERETERKGRRELAGTNEYKVCTSSSPEKVELF